MFSMAKTPRQGDDDPPQRRNRIQAIGGDATLVGRQAFVRAGFSDSTLILHWAEIVGPEVAQLARPIKLVENATGGVLTLKAEPAAAVFLQHDARSLCARINVYLGRDAVHRLRFVPGNLLRRPTLPPTPEPGREAPPADDPSARFVGPEKLKAALLGLGRLRRRAGDGGRD
jgi:hypothetical protein